MSTPLRIAVVGTGFLARTRLRCWRRVFGHPLEIVVAARDVAKAQALAREHGGAQALSLDAALADKSIALFDLCVANRAHRELCERAAGAGKHVLCTKPLTAFWGQGLAADASADVVASTERASMLSRAVQDAEAMLAACTKAGVQLFYGENWVFAPAIARAAALGAASKGRILEMRGGESHSGSHSAYAKDWRHAGGGALLRLGAHPIGAMLWLKRREGERLRGAPVRAISVSAELAHHGGSKLESWGACTLKFDDGSVGLAFGSDQLLGGMQSQLSLLASDHRFECTLSPNDALRAFAPRDGAFGGEYIMEKLDGQAGWTTPIPDEDWSSGHQGLLQSVADALLAHRAPECDGALGAEVVRVVYAAYQSAAEGRRIAL